jgi:MoaA/NifB/PqqE/SkfB family radical SAM enzyme
MNVELKTQKEINHRIDQTSNVFDVFSTLKNVELNIIDSCNRVCDFCPHSLDDYQFVNGRIKLELVEELVKQLNEKNYAGSITICGFGEPLMHKQLLSIIKVLRKSTARIELITNGELLTEEKIKEFFSNGLDFLSISVYEEKFVDRIKSLVIDLDEDKFLVRDRWLGKIKIVDRKNIIKDSNVIQKQSPCWLPSYKMIINHNGDVMLCCNDWTRSNNFGNILHDNIWTIWIDKLMYKRKELLTGIRNGVCKTCNIDGTDYGSDSAKYFSLSVETLDS